MYKSTYNFFVKTDYKWSWKIVQTRIYSNRVLTTYSGKFWISFPKGIDRLNIIGGSVGWTLIEVVDFSSVSKVGLWAALLSTEGVVIDGVVDLSVEHSTVPD